MTISFSAFFDRLRAATDISTQIDLARALDLNRSAITQAKLRDAVPQKWILALARRYTLSPDWLEFGAGPSRPGRKDAVGPIRVKAPPSLTAKPVAPAGVEPELLYVPKAAARLCAGGGSFEVETLPVAEYPFPRSWLARMGRPDAMIFMDVVGDSMEPGICDGDMVLVDQSHSGFDQRSVFAVGVEDAIYLKRVERKNSGLLLLSDNPGYTPMPLAGDELDSFRVIGKVVWMCRDYRYG